MKLTDEEQCMLSMMEITGFPMKIEHGLFMYDLDALAEAEGSFRLYSSKRDSHTRSTSNFAKVCTLFEKWKKDKDAQN
jgi:hypothetical protein